MDVLRILIEGWTASFRYPSFISGYQPTLPSPPLSTIYGLISSAKGELVGPEDLCVGYVFDCESKAVDLETIYELSPNLHAKSNVIKREFLFNPKLHLYIKDLSYEQYFKKPYYSMLFGRSTDLAMVKEIKKIKLSERENINVGKTILPMELAGAHGHVVPLPTHFTDTIPRKVIGVKPYILMTEFFKYSAKCPYDEEKGWGVWFHEK
ncbi:MAG: type I-B CRISPR-associated protein Cas5 [Candidatus Altiarchaeales archaeon HGW-Altiarchaeales-1]|nr:MAG: type I-B CRISPR-associated protein Cas5 [Candidatus Altiarchaeales archaeon HGW-Altiarchaeales-1]